MSRIRTTIAGSLPKPSWLAGPRQLFAPWHLEGGTLKEGQDDAVAVWLAEQNLAGLDIVTDGEQRRRHYIWGFLEALGEVDFENLGLRSSRGQRYTEETKAPRLRSELAWPGPVMREPFEFARARTDRTIKVTLPGPMTLADSVIDDYGGRGDADLAMAYADILNKEARSLADAGCEVIQIDEPCFNIYVDAVADWGIEALERAFDGVNAKRAVHICYGYGSPVVLAWKNANRDWSHYHTTLPLLAKSSIDQVSVEFAASGVDLAVLEMLEGKDALVGVIDVGTEEVETPDVVAHRIEAALRHVEASRLIACTDCGLVPRSRMSAAGKLRSLAKGAALVGG